MMPALDGNWISGLDATDGALALPFWLAGLLAALFVAVSVLAFRRSGQLVSLAVVVRYSMAAIAVLLALAILDGLIVRDRNAERLALDARMAELTARALAPGSPLACLDDGAGDKVAAACEPALFASPQSVAAATAYVAARLALLADGAAFAARRDPAYAARLAAMRRATEADAFGFVAQVLAGRPGCSADTCAEFALVGDPGRIKDNMLNNAFAVAVDRHAAAWATAQNEPPTATASPTAAAAPAPADVPPAMSAVPNLSFPSAASIPAVSIMNAEPTAAAAPAAPTAAPTTPVPARRPADARRRATPAAPAPPAAQPQ